MGRYVSSITAHRHNMMFSYTDIYADDAKTGISYELMCEICVNSYLGFMASSVVGSYIENSQYQKPELNSVLMY